MPLVHRVCTGFAKTLSLEMDIYRRVCVPKNILLVHAVLGAPKSPRGAGVAMAVSMGPVAMRLKRATGSAAVMSALRSVSLRFASSSSAGSGTGEAQRPEWGPWGTSSNASTSAAKDCILLAACGANETLSHNTEHIYTSCFTAWSNGCIEGLTAACLSQSIACCSLSAASSLYLRHLTASTPITGDGYTPYVAVIRRLVSSYPKLLEQPRNQGSGGSETLECCRC